MPPEVDASDGGVNRAQGRLASVLSAADACHVGWVSNRRMPATNVSAARTAHLAFSSDRQSFAGAGW
jgi:hypothetical protein